MENYFASDVQDSLESIDVEDWKGKKKEILLICVWYVSSSPESSSFWKTFLHSLWEIQGSLWFTWMWGVLDKHFVGPGEYYAKWNKPD